jgi:hypothetical protein
VRMVKAYIGIDLTDPLKEVWGLVPGPGQYKPWADKCYTNSPFKMSTVPIVPASSPVLTLPPRVVGVKLIYVNEHCHPTRFPE